MPEDVIPVDELVAALKGETTEETTSTSTEEAASGEETVEAQAAEEHQEEQESESGEAPSKGRSQLLQKILDKYQGDEEKAAASIVEGWNSASKLKVEMEALKQLLQEKEPEPQVVLDKNPDLEWLGHNLQQVEAEQAGNVDRQNEIISEIAKSEKSVARTEGKLEKADEYDARLLKQELSELNKDKRDLVKEWQSLGNRNKSLERDKYIIQRDIKTINGQMEAFKAQKQQEIKETKQFNASFATTYDTAVKAAALEFKIPEERLDYLLDTMRAKGTAYLLSLDSDAKGFLNAEDRDAFVKKQVKAYAEDRGYVDKLKFTEVSKGKQALTKTVVKQPDKALVSKVSTKEEPKGKWTVQYVKERAQRLLG